MIIDRKLLNKEFLVRQVRPDGNHQRAQIHFQVNQLRFTGRISPCIYTSQMLPVSPFHCEPDEIFMWSPEDDYRSRQSAFPIALVVDFMPGLLTSLQDLTNSGRLRNLGWILDGHSLDISLTRPPPLQPSSAECSHYRASVQRTWTDLDRMLHINCLQMLAIY